MFIKNKLIYLKNKETLKFDDFYFKCSIGKKGLTSIKREGDKKTPRGKFDLGNIFYRADRVKKPFSKLTCTKITPKIRILLDNVWGGSSPISNPESLEY